MDSPPAMHAEDWTLFPQQEEAANNLQSTPPVVEGSTGFNPPFERTDEAGSADDSVHRQAIEHGLEQGLTAASYMGSGLIPAFDDPLPGNFPEILVTPGPNIGAGGPSTFDNPSLANTPDTVVTPEPSMGAGGPSTLDNPSSYSGGNTLQTHAPLGRYPDPDVPLDSSFDVPQNIISNLVPPEPSNSYIVTDPFRQTPPEIQGARAMNPGYVLPGTMPSTQIGRQTYKPDMGSSSTSSAKAIPGFPDPIAVQPPGMMPQPLVPFPVETQMPLQSPMPGYPPFDQQYPLWQDWSGMGTFVPQPIMPDNPILNPHDDPATSAKGAEFPFPTSGGDLPWAGSGPGFTSRFNPGWDQIPKYDGKTQAPAPQPSPPLHCPEPEQDESPATDPRSGHARRVRYQRKEETKGIKKAAPRPKRARAWSEKLIKWGIGYLERTAQYIASPNEDHGEDGRGDLGEGSAPE